jgi:hypothetical protein
MVWGCGCGYQCSDKGEDERITCPSPHHLVTLVLRFLSSSASFFLSFFLFLRASFFFFAYFHGDVALDVALALLFNNKQQASSLLHTQ